MCRHRQAAKGAGWGAGEGQVVDPCLPQQTKLLVIMATDLSQCMQKGKKKGGKPLAKWLRLLHRCPRLLANGSQKENGMHHTQFYRMLAECWVFATGTKDPKLH